MPGQLHQPSGLSAKVSEGEVALEGGAPREIPVGFALDPGREMTVQTQRVPLLSQEVRRRSPVWLVAGVASVPLDHAVLHVVGGRDHVVVAGSTDDVARSPQQSRLTRRVRCVTVNASRHLDCRVGNGGRRDASLGAPTVCNL